MKMKMMKPRSRRYVSRNRKKNLIPLSNLRTSEVVRAVVNQPRRLQELANMLDERHRAVRDRAAAILARLSESHPGRLIRIVERIRDALLDDSAYVRWHIVYCLGRIGSSFPAKSSRFLGDLSVRLDDENRIVRRLACQALARVATRKPMLVKQLFESNKKAIPTALARVLQKKAAGRKTEKSRRA